MSWAVTPEQADLSQAADNVSEAAYQPSKAMRCLTPLLL